jgi:hypothetical protein
VRELPLSIYGALCFKEIQMKVDYFKDMYSKMPQGRAKDVHYYLDRIRNGAVKKIVEEIRSKLSKEERNTAKAKLGAVTFCGAFNKRAKEDLKEASGLAILDFDGFQTHEEVLSFKGFLKADKYSFAVWVSPSGLGLKSLVRIPTVETNEEYVSFYNCIVDYYKSDKIDLSGKDISRLCFESYDPDIYVNTESELFVDFIANDLAPVDLGQVTNIPLTDQDDIANRLMTWFKKSYTGQNRNNSFHKLALAFNDFGVEKYTAERYILPNEQKDFKRSEILALINSAYKHTSNFGSKQFEDKAKIKAINSMAIAGRTNEEILKEFPSLEAEKLVKEIELQRKSINIEEFWYYDFEGKLKMSPHKYKFYLENQNFFKHYPLDKSKTFTFITKEDNFVDEVTEFQIKDFVLNKLLQCQHFDQFDLVASSTKAFNSTYLSMLDTASFVIEEDTAEYAMIYYSNVALRIWKDRIEEIDYNDLGGFVWKKQVIDREYKKADHHESVYRSFIWFASGQNQTRYNSLKSVIGYLMHSYKTNANNKAIIFNDETISDNPNGGSGKSLFWNALSHLKKVASIDGKTFEFNKSFPYQTVPTDTQLLVFDDVKKNFNFEALFSLITEGITLEYKGQDAVKLPVKKSPKVLITTNYTIQGVGGSFERRKFEIEMSNYFSANHTPIDEFGHMFFDDWDVKEWQRFDSFMLYCLQYYLKYGLQKPDFKNLVLRKFINETSPEFYEFVIDGNILPNKRLTKAVVFEQLCEEYKDLKKWLSQKKFNNWIKKFAEFKGYEFTEGNSNGARWFELQMETQQEQPTDIWDELDKKAGF